MKCATQCATQCANSVQRLVCNAVCNAFAHCIGPTINNLEAKAVCKSQALHTGVAHSTFPGKSGTYLSVQCAKHTPLKGERRPLGEATIPPFLSGALCA